MKKIEREVYNTIHNSKPGVFNLSIRDKIEHNGNIRDYYLWDSKIYRYVANIGNVVPDYEEFTLAGWDTPTTRSRLNALLINGKIQRRKGKVYFIHNNGRTFEIDINKTYCIDYRG